MAEHSKAEWFRVQALQCIALALRAKDPRIKRLYTLEADRWLRLTEVGGGIGPARSHVLERRTTPRNQSPVDGSILLERTSHVECILRDVSSAGVGAAELRPDKMRATTRLPAPESSPGEFLILIQSRDRPER